MTWNYGITFLRLKPLLAADGISWSPPLPTLRGVTGGEAIRDGGPAMVKG